MLEVAWWALTGTCVDRPAWPRPTGGTPEIAVELDQHVANGIMPLLADREDVTIHDDVVRLQSKFDFEKQA